MASGHYEPGEDVLFDSSEIIQAAKHRTGVQQERIDLSPWGIHLQSDMSPGDLHRILAGIR